jgi:hypothetical protein
MFLVVIPANLVPAETGSRHLAFLYCPFRSVSTGDSCIRRNDKKRAMIHESRFTVHDSQFFPGSRLPLNDEPVLE